MSLPLKELINIGKTQLEEAGVTDALRDAKELYCFLDHIDSVGLMMVWQTTLQDEHCEAYFELVERRASGEPLQHITGVQEFMGMTFKVNPDVLIPRQDTETMVEDAIEVVKQGTLRGEAYIEKGKLKDILDLCCGSGAIGVSLARKCPKAKVTCSDLSAKALRLASENAEHNDCSTIKFKKGDLFEPFQSKVSSKKFDLIISNPPYIKSDVIPTLQREVKDHEPLMALDGGEDGLDFYRRIAAEAPRHLAKGGVLMLEIGYDQGKQVTQLLEEQEAFCQITLLKDLAGKDRILVAKLDNQKKKK